MKLIEISNNHETMYFSTLSKAAKWIGSTASNVQRSIKTNIKCGGYDCKWIKSGDILSRFIDPEYGTHAIMITNDTTKNKAID